MKRKLLFYLLIALAIILNVSLNSFLENNNDTMTLTQLEMNAFAFSSECESQVGISSGWSGDCIYDDIEYFCTNFNNNNCAYGIVRYYFGGLHCTGVSDYRTNAFCPEI